MSHIEITVKHVRTPEDGDAPLPALQVLAYDPTNFKAQTYVTRLEEGTESSPNVVSLTRALHITIAPPLDDETAQPDASATSTGDSQAAAQGAQAA